MSHERRAHPRFACDLEAHLATPGGLTLDTRTVDISRVGICVNAVAAVATGEKVNFSLKLLLETVEADSLAIPAEVVWCTPTEGEFQIGACFRDREMDESARGGLEVLLRFLSGELDIPSAPTDA